VIVADTGAIVALIDRKDQHHRTVRALFEAAPDQWLLPWAILPEVDYLLAHHVGVRAQGAFAADLADGSFAVEWGRDEDLAAADRLLRQYRALQLGLVDAVVMSTATRLRARAIVTFDLRHFGAVKLPGAPSLLPRDGPPAPAQRKAVRNGH
jgi:predicted nucleic acid-binding protein